MTNYVKYVGGKNGAANNKLAPVQIGFFNQQGGAIVIGANATNGAQLAVNYANKHLGGVDGHPIKLVTCFIASAEEEGTTCGQKFLANKKHLGDRRGWCRRRRAVAVCDAGGTKPVIAGVAVTPSMRCRRTR